MSGRPVDIEQELQDMFRRREDDIVVAHAVPAQVSRRITMHKVAYVSVTAVIVLAVAAAGTVLLNDSGARTEHGPVGPAPRQEPEPLENLPFGLLEEGTYVTEEPSFTFSVSGDYEVRAVRDEDAGLVAFFVGESPVHVEFFNVTAVFDPDREKFVKPPDDLVEWLMNNRLVEVAESNVDFLGGHDAVRIDLVPGETVDHPSCFGGAPTSEQQTACTPLFDMNAPELPGTYYLKEGEEFRMWILDIDGEPLIASAWIEGDLDPELPTVEDFLDTIEF